MGDGKFARGICNMLLEDNEVYDGERHTNEQIVVSLEDKLNQVYNALFAKENDYTWEEINVGKCIFSKQIKEKIMRITSMLSEYTSFE
jgi:hypothetical protein